MKPNHASKALATLINCRQPAFLIGAPGIGKSDIVKNFAAENDFEIIDLRCVLLDPVDLRGLPFPEKTETTSTTTWLPPDFLPTEGRGILFLDELPSATRLVQSACLQLVLDRQLGDYHLPDGWHVVAAGNRDIDKAGTSGLITPLIDRFTILQVTTNLEDWCIWAFDNNVPAPIIAFLRFRPELLHEEPTRDSKNFATPRSWANLGKIFNTNPDDSIDHELYAGTVGTSAASEFMAFLSMYRSLPNIDAIMINPKTEPVPEEPCVLYAIITSLAMRANSSNIDQIIDYAERLPEEFNVCLIKDCHRRVPEITHSQAFIRWASTHQQSLL